MTSGVLFICTGNTCRSQMAEGLARHLLPPQVRVLSAGTNPGAIVSEGAIAAMDELGLDIRAQAAKSVASLTAPKGSESSKGSKGFKGSLDGIDRVITLCESAAESCADVLPGKGREHWPVNDPAAVKGSATEVRGAFRDARDDILRRILSLGREMKVEPAVGVVGGTGFYELPGLSELTPVKVRTPFGEPSDDLMVGRLGGRKVVFLARHGRGHRILPSELNQRANIYALKRMGVKKILAVTAVGSLREHIEPGDPVLARQIIDRTHGRKRTFFGDGIVAHVSLADPVCNVLSEALEGAARAETERVHAGGTYVCIQGPQFSTRAESELMRAWGADLVGMTAFPEARLAREAEICYAPLCMPTDYDCWHPSEADVQVDDVIATLHANTEKARRILARAIEAVDPNGPCACQTCLDAAILTQKDSITQRSRVRLHAVLSRVLDGR